MYVSESGGCKPRRSHPSDRPETAWAGGTSPNIMPKGRGRRPKEGKARSRTGDKFQVCV